jgi:asparagine synthase (glutamine-hydrolysing)
MCGIAGAISLREDRTPDPDRVRALTTQIAHRGPDGDGFWSSANGRVLLGHRRLAVIDLVSGQQPMVSRDGRAVITYNGEIYNYRELGKKLQQDGATLATHSDTEVILEAYRREGVASLAAFNGMFAFAIWDAERSSLILARDRIGKKPLYYAIENDCLYFCSSLEALRATARSRWTFDLEAIDSYLALGYIPAPRTVYLQARKLPAATYLTVAGGKLEQSGFWDLAPELEPFSGSYEAASDALDEMLHRAVAMRLRSDVPLGVLLSGGVDSSLVAAVARKTAGNPVQTFSIGFHESAYDETPIARDVAHRLGTEHHEYRVHTETLDGLGGHLGHFGEPFADSSFLPLWALARETRQHVTVALGGDGGDEGFAGYNWYGNALRIARVQQAVPPALASLIAGVVDFSRPVWPASAAGSTRVERAAAMLEDRGSSSRFARLRQLFGPTERRRLAAGALAESARDDFVSRDLRAYYETCLGSDLRRMRYVDIRTYLADCLMPKADVSTMAHALELRAPLLDHEIVRFALSLPDEFLHDGKRGKMILRTLVERYLPASLFSRPKQGFTPPVTEWLRGSHANAARKLAVSERFADLGWFRPAFIEALASEHVNGDRDNGERLFALLVLDEWLKDHG